MRWTVHAVLLMGIGLSLWLLIGVFRTKPVEIPTVTAIMTPPLHRPNDFAAAGRLFGSPTPTATTLPLSETSDIKLVGVTAADPLENSFAIIDVQGEEKVVSLGTALPDGEILKAVTPEGITLEYAGEERSLALHIQQAPADAVFATLPVDVAGTDDLQTKPDTPLAKPAPAVPTAVQLSQLRQVALRVLADRARNAPATAEHGSPP